MMLSSFGKRAGWVTATLSPARHTAAGTSRWVHLLLCDWQSSSITSHASSLNTATSASLPIPRDPIRSSHPIAAAGVAVAARITSWRLLPSVMNRVIAVGRS